MFFPVINRNNNPEIDEQTLSKVYEDFLKLFIKHSDTLGYNTRIYNIIKYFKYDYTNIWCMDISYVLSTINTEDEYNKLKEILNSIVVKEINYENYEILNSEYIEHFINIMDSKYSDEIIEKYKHLYSSVNIPEISIGQ